MSAIGRLYKSGAVKVDVVVKFYNPGDANANELEVVFPNRDVGKVLAVVKTLRPSNFEDFVEGGKDPYEDDGGYEGASVTLSWT